MLEDYSNFYREVEVILISFGYDAHGEGVYTRRGFDGVSDWLSVSGNSYFYIVNAGVVFPDLSIKMRDNLPSQPGIRPLDGISPLLIPFVFAPANRYVELPVRLQDSSELSRYDALELTSRLNLELSSKLNPFHDLKRATIEVEATLDTGSSKAFLLVLAYISLGRIDDARIFAEKTISLFRSESTRRYYENFIRNVFSK